MKAESHLLFGTALARGGSVPLGRQICAAVELAIISGELPAGATLPPIRRLAERLGVAPQTVAQAYRTLADEGLVRAEPRRGIFAADLTDGSGTAAPHLGVTEAIDEAIAVAVEAGVDLRMFVRLAAERCRQRVGEPLAVIVLGGDMASVIPIVDFIRVRLHDAAFRFEGRTYEDLLSGAALLDTAALCYVVPILEVERARRILGAHAGRIVPMTRVLKPEVERLVRGQPPATNFGLIAASTQHISRMLTAVRRLHPLREPPLTATIGERAKVQRLRAEADVIIVAPHAGHSVAADVRSRKLVIDFTFVPDERTMSRIQSAVLDGRRSVPD